MKKIVIPVLIIIVIVVLAIVFRNPIMKKVSTYNQIDNDEISYKYVDDYSEYLSFTESTVKVNELKEENFDGEKSYLIIEIYLDPKKEKVEEYKFEEEEKTTKVYFDISNCNGEYYSMAHTYAFEVKSNNNHVEGYSRVIGKNKCFKGDK